MGSNRAFLSGGLPDIHEPFRGHQRHGTEDAQLTQARVPTKSPDPTDADVWARCRTAGLDPDFFYPLLTEDVS
jgi:hypothetical protein